MSLSSRLTHPSAEAVPLLCTLDNSARRQTLPADLLAVLPRRIHGADWASGLLLCALLAQRRESVGRPDVRLLACICLFWSFWGRRPAYARLCVAMQPPVLDLLHSPMRDAAQIAGR